MAMDDNRLQLYCLHDAYLFLQEKQEDLWVEIKKDKSFLGQNVGDRE